MYPRHDREDEIPEGQGHAVVGRHMHVRVPLAYVRPMLWVLLLLPQTEVPEVLATLLLTPDTAPINVYFMCCLMLTSVLPITFYYNLPPYMVDCTLKAKRNNTQSRREGLGSIRFIFNWLENEEGNYGEEKKGEEIILIVVVVILFVLAYFGQGARFTWPLPAPTRERA
jgi:hypothetical protein